jgi:hypothetical protein
MSSEQRASESSTVYESRLSQFSHSLILQHLHIFAPFPSSNPSHENLCAHLSPPSNAQRLPRASAVCRARCPYGMRNALQLSPALLHLACAASGPVPWPSWPGRRPGPTGEYDRPGTAPGRLGQPNPSCEVGRGMGERASERTRETQGGRGRARGHESARTLGDSLLFRRLSVRVRASRGPGRPGEPPSNPAPCPIPTATSHLASRDICAPRQHSYLVPVADRNGPRFAARWQGCGPGDADPDPGRGLGCVCSVTVDSSRNCASPGLFK